MITYLYIKECSHCGLQYFGKTAKNPYSYSGSGKVWKRHIKKYGKDKITTTKVWEFENITECSTFAIQFSEKNVIVKSNKWANLKPENGLDGGAFCGEYNPNYGKRGTGVTFYGRKHTSEAKKKMWEKKAKQWLVISPDGDRQIIKDMTNFCRENKLHQSNMYRVAKGKQPDHHKWKCELLHNA